MLCNFMSIILKMFVSLKNRLLWRDFVEQKIKNKQTQQSSTQLIKYSFIQNLNSLFRRKRLHRRYSYSNRIQDFIRIR